MELSFALAFAFAVLWASSDQRVNLQEKTTGFILILVTLTAWWMFYLRQIIRLGEFERVVAVQALAVTCALVLWVATVWALATALFGFVSFPLFLIAPLAAMIFALVRFGLFLRYR